MRIQALPVVLLWSVAVASTTKPAFASKTPASCSLSTLVSSGLMADHDLNRDEKLNMKEALQSLPLFSRTLADGLRHAGIAANWITIESAFTYALKYEAFPQRGYAGSMRFYKWMNQRWSWSKSIGNKGAEAVAKSIEAVLCAPISGD